MPRIAFTANATITEVMTLGPDETGVSIQVTSDSSLGGGTLTLSRRDARKPTETPVALDTLIAGDQYEYRTGGNTSIFLTLAGATSPSVAVYVERVR